jgi:nicotinamide mononucleotide transporter
MSYLEISGVVTGLISVWLFVKQSVWSWIWTIVNSIIYAYIFYGVKLYPDVMLQTVFFSLSIYGWWQWARGNVSFKGNVLSDTLPVTVISAGCRFNWALLISIVALGMGWFYKRYTAAAFPFTDSLTTTISLFAQYFLTIKKLENWILWIIADVIMIIMYHLKGLDLTAILFFIYLLMCIRGIIEWNRTRQLA